MPKLTEIRGKGILEYGILGQLHSVDFEEKWIKHRAGREAEFLTAPEISTLSNYGKVYEGIQQLKPFPADLGALYSLAIAAALPVLPVILAEVPIGVVIEDLLKALH